MKKKHNVFSSVNLLFPAAIFSRRKSLIPGSAASIEKSVLATSTSCAIAGSGPKQAMGAVKIASPITQHNRARLDRI
jgi:hypothetical protein